MNHGQEGARLPPMRTGHPPDEQLIEGVGAVKIHDRLARQDAVTGGIEAQSKDERMSIEQQQPVIRVKRNLRMAQAETPLPTSLGYSSRRRLSLRVDERKRRWFCRGYRGMHGQPHYPQHPPAKTCRCWQATQQA